MTTDSVLKVTNSGNGLPILLTEAGKPVRADYGYERSEVANVFIIYPARELVE